MDVRSETATSAAPAPDPLVLAIAAGNAEAERSFVERYARGVRALVVRACRPGDPIVDDIVQDVLLTVLGRLRQGALNDSNALPAYLQATIVHATRAEYRRRGARGDSVDAEFLESIPDSQAGPSERLHQHHLQRALADLVESLPVERDRAVLRGFYLEDRDRDAMCAELGIDEGHFRRVLHRARERLRALIEATGWAPEP